MNHFGLFLKCAVLGMSLSLFEAVADVRVVFEHKANDEADKRFRFETVPPPTAQDCGTEASFKLMEGEPDPNSGGIQVLKDGKLPKNEDQPRENFFFRAGTDGGRLLVDLGQVIEIKRVCSFSWHPGSRAPQVYRLFGAESVAKPDLLPKRAADPKPPGWKQIVAVDTRSRNGEPGGQYGVSIHDSQGTLGSYRYLLFDIFRAEETDFFGNTFYSEIDIIAANSPEPAPIDIAAEKECIELVDCEGYHIRIDTSEAADLTAWAHNKIAPMARQWYPRLNTLLGSDEFEPPRRVTIIFDDSMRGVADTGGARIRCAARWFRQNLEGEALGAVFHELVHVVQQYGRAPRSTDGGSRPPGWLVEGIADYVRWYEFEPESRGAEITAQNISRARFNASYRITANFLNWVSGTYARDLVPRLNACIRQGKYSQGVWKEITGKELQELGDEWRTAQEEKVRDSAGKIKIESK